MEELQEKTNVLLQKIALDDNDAFRTFYDRYYLKVYQFSSYFVRSQQLIEEIVSDVFCAIWQNRKKNTGIKNFEGYLYTITKNRAIYYLKQEKFFFIDESYQDFINLIKDDKTPEFLIIDEEITLILKDAINELPERCRIIFLMAREQGLKYREIAKVLSISEKTVNAQMVIAIKKLAKKVGDIVFLFF